MTGPEEDLIAFVHQLKEAGFEVYASTYDNYTHISFVKDNKIGYAEAAKYIAGIDLSTVHKPRAYIGTGFVIATAKVNPTIEDAIECFMLAPGWVCSRDRSNVSKYSSWEEYTNLNKWLEYKEI